jgi:hypothetical protein
MSVQIAAAVSWRARFGQQSNTARASAVTTNRHPQPVHSRYSRAEIEQFGNGVKDIPAKQR